MSAAIAVVLAAGLCGVPPGNTGVFKPLQPFGAPRAGGYGLETFQIDEQWFVAEANFFGTSSTVYKYHPDRAELTPWQIIPSHAGHAWRHFVVPGGGAGSSGDTHYLALANYRTGFPPDDPNGWPKGPGFARTVTTTNSTIWRWDGAKFVLFQSIPTDGANAWAAFVVDDAQYLAVGNAHRGDDDAAPAAAPGGSNSSVFRLDPGRGRFELVQNLTTYGALDVEAFAVGADTYLAVANTQNGSSFTVGSAVYRWAGGAAGFVQHQRLATTAATGVTHFVIGRTHFLAVANRYGRTGHRENSQIFALAPGSTSNATAPRFVPHQTIATKGAYDWEHFVVGRRHFLAVANHWDEQAPNRSRPIDIDSVLYVWSDAAAAFEAYQNLPTTGAEQWRHFAINESEHMLAVAQCVDGGTAYPAATNLLYRWHAAG